MRQALIRCKSCIRYKNDSCIYNNTPEVCSNFYKDSNAPTPYITCECCGTVLEATQYLTACLFCSSYLYTYLDDLAYKRFITSGLYPIPEECKDCESKTCSRFCKIRKKNKY